MMISNNKNGGNINKYTKHCLDDEQEEDICPYSTMMCFVCVLLLPLIDIVVHDRHNVNDLVPFYLIIDEMFQCRSRHGMTEDQYCTI